MTYHGQIDQSETRVLIASWHSTKTVKRILGELAADGFPNYSTVTIKGIRSDVEVREYDRDCKHVTALIAARAMWLELVWETGRAGVDFTSADEIVELAQRRHDWQEEFLSAIADMELDFPPYGNDATKAAAAGDVFTDPTEAAQTFVTKWEADRLAKVAAFHAEQGA